MELLQLKYFVSAAETCNFSLTAKKYNVPPSNISQTVSRLERELGALLFDRYPNRLYLNERGKKFYNYVRRALELLEDGCECVADDCEETVGEIRLSVCANRRIVTYSIEKFKAEYPDVSFLINHNVSDDADLIIADESDVSGKMNKTLLVSEDMLLAFSRNNDLYRKEVITSDDLREQWFITMHNESSMYKYTKMICNSMGFEPVIAIQSDDPYYVRKYIEMGLGISIVPSYSWKGLFSEDTVFRSLGNYKRKTYVFTKDERYTPKCVELFLDELIKSCCMADNIE